LNVKDASGKSIFAGGKKFTGFSNAEEMMVDKVKTIPFLLEDKLGSFGGAYEKSGSAWAVSNDAICTIRASSPRGRTGARSCRWQLVHRPEPSVSETFGGDNCKGVEEVIEVTVLTSNGSVLSTVNMFCDCFLI
jgi:hypothetical protein